MNKDNSVNINIAPATFKDGPAIHQLVCLCGSLDQNSRYLYLLLCSHFNDYTLTAKTDDGVLAGFVSAYVIPNASDTLFIWQVAVSSEYRNHGIASRMITCLVEKARKNGICYIHATVTPSNITSFNMLKKVAGCFGAGIETDSYFPEELFSDNHEEERLVKIGPLKTEGDN